MKDTAAMLNREHQGWHGLAALLDLELISGHSVRSKRCEDNRNGRIFGGQLLGQVLKAAMATVEPGRPPTALHVLFLQGGLSGEPIDYHMTDLQSGKRFSSRHISGIQGDRVLVDAHATFGAALDGFDHQLPAPDVAPPEGTLSIIELHEVLGPERMGNDLIQLAKPHLELRVIKPEAHVLAASSTPRLRYWLKLKDQLGDDARLHAAALAYLSDYWINSAAITHHVAARDAFSQLYVASLNHSIWFHRHCRSDDWLLIDAESPSAQKGRTLTTARIYDRSGMLAATTAQECLVTPRPSGAQ